MKTYAVTSQCQTWIKSLSLSRMKPHSDELLLPNEMSPTIRSPISKRSRTNFRIRKDVARRKRDVQRCADTVGDRKSKPHFGCLVNTTDLVNNLQLTKKCTSPVRKEVPSYVLSMATLECHAFATYFT